MSQIFVMKPGMLTTIQDEGRWGFQSRGVPVAGPMDPCSHRLANALVGNPREAATLEITLLGPELEFADERVIAVAGAEFDVSVDGRPARTNAAFLVAAQSRLRFGRRRRGARAYLAVAGGIAVPPTLGSRATHLVSGMGPLGGRALRANDMLPIGRFIRRPPPQAAGTPLALPDGGARLRIVPAVHLDRFTNDAWGLLTHARFVVTPQSNRMGYRLEGPVLSHAGAADILSEGIAPGTIQVPSSGQPILLMAERATTGGYATIANVISADLPIAGQLAPGEWIEFDACTHDAARGALRVREAQLAGLPPESDQVQTHV
jgi:antagonist of KipI